MPKTTRWRIKRRLTFALKDIERAGMMVHNTAMEYEEGGEERIAEALYTISRALAETATALEHVVLTI